MVNSCNSRSPILLDTPERGNGSPNGVIEITDHGSGNSWGRRRRLETAGDEVLENGNRKRPRVDIPVIDLTLDTDEEFSSTPHDTERLLLSMREQMHSSSRRLVELHARREQMMNMLPDDARRRLRRVISRHRLTHPRFPTTDGYHDNAGDDTTADATRSSLLPSNQHGENGVRPIVVDDDDVAGVLTSVDEDFSLPSCSRVTPSRVFTPSTNNTRSSTGTSSRTSRSNSVLHFAQQNDQGSSTNEAGRGVGRDPLRNSRTRHNHRRRHASREPHWSVVSASARAGNTRAAHSNTNQVAAAAAAAATLSSDYEAPTINETLSSAFPEVETSQQSRRYTSRGNYSAFEQPLQPYYPELLIQGMLSFWNHDTLRHLGEPEEEREDYEALWNLTERLGQVKPKGLSKADMEDIPAFRYSAASKSSSNGSCVVCLMNYSNKEKLRRLPCNHDFHSKCIDRWLKNNRSCPVCRKDVVSKA